MKKIDSGCMGDIYQELNYKDRVFPKSKAKYLRRGLEGKRKSVVEEHFAFVLSCGPRSAR